MAVSKDHNSKTRDFRLQIEVGEIVERVDRDTVQLNDFGRRQFLRPRRFIDISADGCHWGNLFQLIENFERTYISGVNDVLRTAQAFDRLRTKQAMRVGDDANDDGSSQFAGLWLEFMSALISAWDGAPSIAA